MSAPEPKPVSVRRMAFAGPAAVLGATLVTIIILVAEPECPGERIFAAIMATALAAFGVASGLLRRAGGRTLVGLYIGMAAGAAALLFYWLLYAGLDLLERDSGTSALLGGFLAYFGAWMTFGGLYAGAEFGLEHIRSGILAGLRAGMWLPLLALLVSCLGSCVMAPLFWLGPILLLILLFGPAYGAAYLFFDEIHHGEILSFLRLRSKERRERWRTEAERATRERSPGGTAPRASGEPPSPTSDDANDGASGSPSTQDRTASPSGSNGGPSA